MATRHWRLRIRNQADTSDLLVLSSVPGGTNPYITAPPRGDGQSIDPILGKSTIGRYTVCAADHKETATERTITKVLADANARNQLSSNRTILSWSDDVGANWNDQHTGYLNRHRLVTAPEWEFTLGDTDRREQQREIFKYVDRQTGNFPKVSCIIGGPIPGGFGFATGLQLDFGAVRFKVIANPSGLITSTNRVTLELVSGFLRPWYEVAMTSFQQDEKETINRLAKDYFEYDPINFATNGTQDSQPFGWFPGLVVEMDPVAAGPIVFTNPIAKETQKRSKLSPAISPEGPVGEHDALVNGSSPRMIVYWDTAVHGAAPAVNTLFDVLVYPKAISKSAPLHISGHPLDILVTLLFENGIPYDAASVTATRADPSVGDQLRVELVVEGPAKLGKWLTENILGPFGIGMRIKDDGEREIFPTRGANPTSVATVGINDLVSPNGGAPDTVIFDVDEKTTINGVDYEFRTFKRFRNPTHQTIRGVTVKTDGDDKNSQTINLLTYGSFTIEGRRSATHVQGERVHTFKIPGQLLFYNSGLNAYTSSNQTLYVLGAGDTIIDRTGWGVIEGSVRVKASTPGLPGDFIDLTAPHQVNALTSQTPKAQRGGTRKVQIVKRTNEPSASLLDLWDAGNLPQVVPPDDGTNTDPTPVGIVEPAFTLAAQSVPPVTGGVADPLHVATVTITNGAALAAAGADVHFEYLVQTATPSASDAGLPFGVLTQPDVVGTIDTPAISPSGQTVWVRAQSRVPTTGQSSAWSAWDSITLGPAQNGAGNEVAAPSLSFTIDAAGLADILAAVTGGNVASVKFAAAAVGAAEATDAAVRAATADTVAPFEALNIFTLQPGEQRAVSAFAYDSFGNESQKATVIVRHASVPPPHLTYVIDGAGLVDVLANVGTTVTSVKFAAASVGAAEATDSAVRAATADSVAPFEALDIFTLAVGESRAVSAFAYDANGIESPKATVMVVRPATAVARKYGGAFIIDGGGSVITTGEKPGYVRVPATGFIRGWSLYGKAGAAGNLEIDSWKDTHANHPPTVADTIWGGSKPTLTAQDKNSATGLSIAVTEGDILRHKVDVCTLHDEGTLNYHFEAT
jgi:hypothetical protein